MRGNIDCECLEGRLVSVRVECLIVCSAVVGKTFCFGSMSFKSCAGKRKRNLHGANKIKCQNAATEKSTRLGVVHPGKQIVLRKLIKSTGDSAEVLYIRPEHMSAFASNPRALGQSYYFLQRANLQEMKVKVKYPQYLADYVRVLENDATLSGLWMPHRAVSAASGFDASRIVQAEQEFGYFLWSNVFENY